MWSAILDRVLRRPKVAAVLAAGVLVALAIPALGMHTASAGVDAIPQGHARDQDVQPHHRGVPGRQGLASTWSSRPRTSPRPRSPPDQAARGACRGQQDRGRHDRRRHLQGQDGRPGHDPDRRQGHRRAVAWTRWPRCATTSCPATVGKVPRRRGRRRRRHRRHQGLQRHDQGQRADRVRCSSSAWRSCSCWSRSARWSSRSRRSC